MTDRQKQVADILTDTSDYKSHEYCTRAPGGLVHETYFSIENNLYYIKFHHHKLHANGNIITEDKAYSKELIKIV